MRMLYTALLVLIYLHRSKPYAIMSLHFQMIRLSVSCKWHKLHSMSKNKTPQRLLRRFVTHQK